MRIDHFRIEVQQFKTENDRKRLNELVYSTYPDVLLEVHESLAPGRNQKGTPKDFTIDEGAKGVFVLKKIVERFDPWISIEGHARLDRSDFPQELFLNASEGGVGQRWPDIKKRVDEVIQSSPPEVSDSGYFRIEIKQFETGSNDIDYLNKKRHSFPQSFVKVYETIGPNDVEMGTPSDFLLKNNTAGTYVLKKVIERFDPWLSVSGVIIYDKIDVPDALFGTVEEGGVGRNWSDAARERVQEIDWP